MIEGEVHWFWFHEIIRDVNDKKYYVYSPAKLIIGSALTKSGAEDVVIEKFCGYKISHLNHPGIKLFKYEHNNKLYILSLLETIYKEYPYFDSVSYPELILTRNWSKYLHNENGPANICVQTGENIFFWRGNSINKEQWEKAVRDKNFKKTMEDFLNEE